MLLDRAMVENRNQNQEENPLTSRDEHTRQTNLRLVNYSTYLISISPCPEPISQLSREPQR